MNELLKINYEAEQPTVSARDLHEQLHIGTKFTTWFERMKEYGFSEGKEFFPKLGETIKVFFRKHAIPVYSVMTALEFYHKADEELLNTQVVELRAEDGTVVVELKGEER